MALETSSIIWTTLILVSLLIASDYELVRDGQRDTRTLNMGDAFGAKVSSGSLGHC